MTEDRSSCGEGRWSCGVLPARGRSRRSWTWGRRRPRDEMRLAGGDSGKQGVAEYWSGDDGPGHLTAFWAHGPSRVFLREVRLSNFSFKLGVRRIKKNTGRLN